MKSSKTEEKNIKIVGYCRVSTKKQSDRHSLESQREAIEKFAFTNKKDLLGFYTEVESGRKNNREQLAQAIDYCKREKATLVIAYIDRLARDVEFLFHLKNSELDFQALDLPDCNTMTLGTMAMWAQYQAEQISEKTKAGLAMAKAKGKNVGGVRMCIDGKTNIEKAIESSIKTRKEKAMTANIDFKNIIEVEIKKGTSYAAIARQLNAYKIKTAKGGQWSAAQISRIVKMYDLKKGESND